MKILYIHFQLHDVHYNIFLRKIIFTICTEKNNLYRKKIYLNVLTNVVMFFMFTLCIGSKLSALPQFVQGYIYIYILTVNLTYLRRKLFIFYLHVLITSDLGVVKFWSIT